MNATGVFSSCVTAATKSDFIEASAALARSARTVRTSASRLAPAAIEIRKNMRRAPCSVATSARSGSERTCTVHSRSRTGWEAIAFTSAWSMNSSGNRWCRSPEPSGSTGVDVTARPLSSDTEIDRPPGLPPIFSTCFTSGSKYWACTHGMLTVNAMNPSSWCGGLDAKRAWATTWYGVPSIELSSTRNGEAAVACSRTAATSAGQFGRIADQHDRKRIVGGRACVPRRRPVRAVERVGHAVAL